MHTYTQWTTLALVLGAFVTGGFRAQAQDAAPADGDKVAIELELPEPYFGGTPLDYFGENLEPSWKKRPPVYAPAGVSNVAVGKPVSASSDPLVGKLDMIADADKSYEDKSLIELPEGAQWVQIDLGAPHTLYGVAMWHYHAADRVYFDVIVKTADDADFTQNVQVLFNNDHDNSSGMGNGEDKEYVDSYKGRLIDAKGVTARYVRLYSNGNTSGDTNHYVEVEVFGAPAN